MKAIVTGGAGFIGSYLVEKLLGLGIEVHVFDNLSSGRLEQVPDKAVFHEADIRFEETGRLLERIAPQAVFHLAAQADVQKSLQNPSYDTCVNVLGTVNLLQACVNAKVRKLIFASTSAVYGDLQSDTIGEEDATEPISYYGLSKLVAERYIRLFALLYGLPYTILRYANVYGARQTVKGEGGVVALFMNRVRQGEPLIVHGDGEQTRDFIYVGDIVSANIAAMERGDGQTIQVSTGTPTSVNALTRLIRDIHGEEFPIAHQQARAGDIRYSCLRNEKARELLAWQPQYSVLSGLKKTYQELRITL